MYVWLAIAFRVLTELSKNTLAFLHLKTPSVSSIEVKG